MSSSRNTPARPARSSPSSPRGAPARPSAGTSATRTRKASRASATERRAPDDLVQRDPPEVYVDFVFDAGVLHVAVVNGGREGAYDVKVVFDRAFRGLGGTVDVSALRLFRGITFLAPGRRVETLIDSSSAYFARREPTRLTAHVTWRDAAGRQYERRIPHDLAIYKDITYLVPDRTRPMPAPGFGPIP